MAVAHTNHSGVMINVASSANTSSLTPAGSEGAVTAGVFWFASTGQTLSTVKHGSGGTNLNAVSGSTATRSASGGNNLQGRGYALAVGSTANGVYVTFSASVLGYLEGHINDSANQTTPAVSGFGQGGFSAVGSGNTPTTLTLTQTGIACAVSDMVDAFGFFQANVFRSVSGVSSTTGTETFDSGLSVYRGAAYYDTADSTSETAAMTGSAPAYYSGAPYYAYYHPNLWGVMVGMVVQQSAGGGGTPYTAELTAAAFGMTPAALNRISDYLAILSAPAFNLTPQSLAQSTTYSAQLTAPSLNLTPQDVDARYGYVAALTAAVFSMTAQALNRLLAFTAELSAAAFALTAQAITRTTTYAAELSAPAFNLTPEDANYENSLDYVAQLTAAVFGMSGEDLTVLRAYIAELTAPVFNFTARILNFTGTVKYWTRHATRTIMRPLTRDSTDRGQDDG